jgi:hypothetical protein
VDPCPMFEDPGGDEGFRSTFGAGFELAHARDIGRRPAVR